MNTVEVRNAYKHYGKGSDQRIVLNQLNMTVVPGSIYGLMGASGCGKTTLLSCIVGMIQLDGGKVNVFGNETTQNSAHQNEKMIGYMPQEMALIGELTIKETIYYFGRIFQMDIEKLRERYDMLHKLLELPYDDKRVEECSGGQMRRVSFAAAMIHEPGLLILDEPTVGLDPILREKIWHFMLDVTRTSKLSIIITTHYIEEARQADCVGLMRNGILLAEDTPYNVMNRLNVDNLEEAFLHLCMKRGSSEEAEETPVAVAQNNATNNNNEFELQSNMENLNFKDDKLKQDIKKQDANMKFRWNIIRALLVKNVLQLKRQPAAIIFLTALPLFQLFLFYYSIGGFPVGLKIGIVDDEIINFDECRSPDLISTYVHDNTCELNLISCRFLSELTDDIGEKVYYTAFDDAFQDAKKGKLIAIIYFDANFTESLDEIRRFPDEAHAQTRENSVIKVYMEQTDLQLTYFIQRKLYDVYNSYSQKVLTDCNLPKKLDSIPIDFQEPIYGSFKSDYKHSMVPPFSMLIIFNVAAGLTIASIVYERKEGFWNRTLLAGVSTLEIMSAHVIINVVILTIQLIEILTLIAVIFDTHNQGSYSLVCLMMALLGCSGIFFGLWVSCVCSEIMTAHLLMTGIAQPITVLSGMFWPVEGMPFLLRMLSYSTPTTWPSISMRDIIEKGFTITHKSILIGFLILFIWVGGTMLLGLRSLSKKKYSRNT